MLKDDTTVSDKPPCVFYVNTTGGRGELSVIIITDYCISFKAGAYSFLLLFFGFFILFYLNHSKVYLEI